MPEKESDLSKKKATAETDKSTAETEDTAKADKSKQKVAAKTAKKENSAKKTAETAEQLQQLQQKYSELEDKYYRAEAEMANMHKRFKKEQEQLLKYDGQSLARDVLPVLDNLSRALKIEATDEAAVQLKHGVEMVYRDMEKALKDNHVTRIDALGKPFDPTFHQAVKTVPVEKDQTAETVVEVFQDGYLLKDRVLRPAMVVVAQ
ncbi:MAG: nucleotide exchange factor GrpE [Liquorilactobacillus ghanensis]|uniref:nucleotide exchange factor GrpE n=1 Tax=Liquorilactobacillus ghanensis TaxID=399370 RepID=UPI0039EB6D6C